MDVGIRELRSNLARILDEVDKGTVVTITHHGRPRATLQAVTARAETPIERAIREGRIVPGPNFSSPRADRRPRVGMSRSDGRRAWAALMEDREDDR